MQESVGKQENRPKRIQRKRTKGWKMPDGAVYVGRPTIYGNPYLVIPGGFSRADAVALFRQWVAKCGGWSDWNLSDLRGKNLACWCPLDVPCHADVLLEIANSTAVPACNSTEPEE